jgi:reverse gyrase
MPIYRGICPHCGGDSRVDSIVDSGVCEKCMDRGEGVLRVYMDFVKGSEGEFEHFFEELTGFKPWGAQRHWIRRILRGENTVLIAPTGVGKTTLLIVYAIYASMRGKRVLYVTPTKSLLAQTYSKILTQAERVGGGADKVICYDSSRSRKSREVVLEKIKTCSYSLLVITNHFLLKNYGLVSSCRPDVVIVDDVDSLLKSEKSTYNLIKLLGYTDKAIELAKKRSSILWKLMVSKAYGRNTEEIIREYLEVDGELEREIASTKSSQLIVASATGRSRGLAGRILRDLLRIDLSGISIYGRNVLDSYLIVESTSELINEVTKVVEKLGRGCILYLSPRHPLRSLFEDVIEGVKSRLEEKGYTVARANPRSISMFLDGKVDVLIGYSTYYGSSVRGLDAPLQIKYAVFLGTPVFTVSLESFLAKINMLTRTLMEIASVLNDRSLRKTAVELKKKTLTLSPSEKRILGLCLVGKIPEESIASIQRLAGIYGEVKDVYKQAVEKTKAILDREGVLTIGTITLVKSGEHYSALIPDPMTYIQASGRTSRLVGNTMTHGFSVIAEFKHLENAVRGLEERMRSFNRELEFRRLSDVDLSRELDLIESSRSGRERSELKYKSILLVVESPTKAKTIARFFGRPIARRVRDISIYTIPAKIGQEVVEFNIVATRGHIYDLTTDSGVGVYGVILGDGVVNPVYSSIRKCRVCGTQFIDQDKCPRCGSVAYTDSKYVVEVLRKLASEVDEVYIATDPDIEGEKIAFDVYVSIKPVNQSIWRIELHEITLSELLKAMESRREINTRLVEAEMYRRILDRLVGFSLSSRLQVLYESRNLGAGRVQTPVLGLIIDRYREHVENKCRKLVFRFRELGDLYFSTCIDKSNTVLIEELKSIKKIKLVKEREDLVEVSPKPPFTTDELIAEAARIGLSVEVAMKTAQELFEAGLITYHRTDSTYVSSLGLSIARDYLSKRNLSRYARLSHWGSQGAHEAIRPVYPLDPDELIQAVDEGLIPVAIPITGLHLKLYGLIFRRFIASQMKPFKATKALFRVYAGSGELGSLELYTSIVEDGFNKVQSVRVFESLRDVSEVFVDVLGVDVFDSSRVPLYTSGEVVLLMKKLGIGRPSTYSKIISSIKRHGYVVESRERRKLVPTKRGVEVYEYLKLNYPDLVSIEVTRRMEDTIDAITRGDLTGVEGVREVLTHLAAYKLVEEGLIPLLHLDNNVGFNPALNNLTTN